MSATAHLVRSPRGEEAIHAFLHEHGPIPWPRDVFDWPETRPGTRVRQSTVLPVGGNDVRACLEVLAPDGTPWDEVHAAIADVAPEMAHWPKPLGFTSGRVTARFGTEASLSDQRAAVLERLVASVERLVSGG